MKTLFFDGAFGTYYSNLFGQEKSCEFACIYHPERVAQIHSEYIDAGVNCIKTNSFGANSLLCQNKDTIKEIIEKSYQIAKNVAKDKSVFADIGYINSDDSESEYLEITKLFIAQGATNFLFETLAEYKPIIKSIKYIKKNVPNSVVVVSFAVEQNGWTRKGLYYENLINKALELCDYSGLNCYCGPYHMIKLLEKIKNFKDISSRLTYMPNTSYPSYENNRLVMQSDNMDYYSDKLCEMFAYNIGAIGGCCGSTPEHIGLFLDKIKNRNIKEKILNVEIKGTETKQEKSKFLESLEKGKKIIACELDGPVDADCSFVMESAKKLKSAGCNLITIADSPLARPHADSFIISAKIKRECNIEVLPHLACRDRNIIGIKGTLLGGNIENINNVLAITGDPMQNAKSKGNFDFNSFTLTEYIKELNKEVFVKRPYCIASALNVNSSNFDVELKRAEKKVAKGSQVFLTQPIYTDEAVERLRIAKNTLGVYILGGIMPVVSYKNAMFLNNEVYGINIPEEIVEKFKDKDKEQSLEIAKETSIEIANKIKNICDGYYFMIPLKKVDLICSIIDLVEKNKI